MTAIFVYADNTIAFAAADTMRVIPGFAAVSAEKIHRWGDHVVLAQAGDGNFLSKLVFELQLKKPMIDAAYPALPDDQRLIQAFRNMQPSYYSNACQAVSKLASGSAHISGTLLVGSSADAHGPARIHSLDFTSGIAAPVAGLIASDGTNPQAFTKQAGLLLASLKQSPCLWQIDQWGVDCVSWAISQYPKNVGWPIDVMISRQSSVGERIIVTRRIVQGSPVPLAEFLV